MAIFSAACFALFAPSAFASKNGAVRQRSTLAGPISVEALPAPPPIPGLHSTGVVTQDVWTSGRYTFVRDSSLPPPTNGLLGTLIDEQTGKRTVISQTGCVISLGSGLVGARPASPIGGPWLLFNCGSASVPLGHPALYGIASGQWQVIAPNSSVEAFKKSCVDTECGAPAIAVGADWIEFDETCYHCGDTYVFQNIQTGQFASDPTNATTTVDLSSPTLAHKVCAPLRALPGLLTFYGSFAIADQGLDYPDLRVYLEHCGTHLHKLIDPQIDVRAASSQLVLWRSSPTRLVGLFLPSLRPFTITIPARIGDLQQLAISTRSLYVLSLSGHLWTAPLPVLPRPRSGGR